MTNSLFYYSWFRQHLTALAVGIILCTIYLYLFAFKSYFEINIETSLERNTNFKVFWAQEEEAYSESRSSRLRIQKGDYHLKMYLGNLDRIRKLRIDPLEYDGPVKIKSLSLSQDGYQTIALGPGELDRLVPLNQILSLELQPDGLMVITSHKDGNLELLIEPIVTGKFPWTHLLNIFVILFICLALRNTVAKLQDNQIYVVTCLTAATILIAVMATITTIHVHPDERVHLEAVKYYGDHFLPPPIDSPEISKSFSDYGKSRLSSYELYYPLAGYFTQIISPFKLSTLLSARVFGVFLFACLLMLAVARPNFRYFALPLIITPQIWYLYSYPNSDGFALMISLIAAYQLAVSETALNRFLSESKPKFFILSLVGFSALGGAMLLSKINFYFFGLFLFLYLCWRLLNGYYPNPKRLWGRVAIISLLAISIYGVRYGLDIAANGSNPQVKVNEYAELNAKREFRPSTPMHEKHVHLQIKQRGYPLDVVMSFGWAPITFATAFGSYGYTQYFGTDQYFSIVKLLISLLIGSIIVFSLINGPPNSHALILLACCVSGLLMVASIWSSWTVNFQPQGRYMAPIIPMISVIYYHVKEYMSPPLITGLTLSLFVMSVYSFVFIGLGQIAKTSIYTGVG